MGHIRRTTCNRDCPDACGIVAHVDDDGTIVRLQGDKSHPVTQGFLCQRTSRFLQVQYAKERVVRPLVRKDGVLVEASWDEALDVVAAHLKTCLDESGAESIFHYRSGGNLGQVLSVCDLFWRALGGITEKSGDICTGAVDAAHLADFGALDANDIHDIDNAAHVVVWGKNLQTCSPHTYSLLKKRVDKGELRCTVIDPLPTKTTRLGERWIQPRPGGDAALAFAVARRLLEWDAWHDDVETFADGVGAYRALVLQNDVSVWAAMADVEVDDVDHLAQAFARPPEGEGAAPVTTMMGWGMGRRRQGAATLRAVDALHIVTGHIGVVGASVASYFNRKAGFVKAKDVVDVSVLVDDDGGAASPSRTLSEPLLAEQLEAASPQVRAMWVTAGNPVAMLPDSGRMRRAIEAVEQVVVVDWWMSDTAQVADVVLPAATLLERDDVMGGYGHHYVSQAQAVVPPLGDSKDDLTIMQLLAARMGLEEKLHKVGFFDDAKAWSRRLAQPLEHASEGTYDEMSKRAVRNPKVPKVAFAGRAFATPSGRAQLLNAWRRPVTTSGLSLLAVSTPASQSSQQVRLDAPRQRVQTRVHPSVHPEGPALICSARGQLRVDVVHVADMRADVVHVDKGASDVDGTPVNTLVGGLLTDDGEGAALYEETVWLDAASPA